MLLLALPYLLLRLVADFVAVPRWLAAGAPGGLVLAALAVAALPVPLPAPGALALAAYFVAVTGYATWALVRAARPAAGVTRRRLRAAALGSGFLGLVLVFAGAGVVLPVGREAWMPLGRLAGLASGLCYLVAFAPPAWLRRAWQEPEVRAYLARASRLPYLPDDQAVVRALEDGAALALGAAGAALGLWHAELGALRFSVRLPAEAGAAAPGPAPAVFDLPPGQMVAGRAFAAQRAVLATDAARDDPAHAGVYRRAGAGAVLAAPVTAGGRRLGVLAVYARAGAGLRPERPGAAGAAGRPGRRRPGEPRPAGRGGPGPGPGGGRPPQGRLPRRPLPRPAQSPRRHLRDGAGAVPAPGRATGRSIRSAWPPGWPTSSPPRRRWRR